MSFSDKNYLLCNFVDFYGVSTFSLHLFVCMMTPNCDVFIGFIDFLHSKSMIAKWFCCLPLTNTCRSQCGTVARAYQTSSMDWSDLRGRGWSSDERQVCHSQSVASSPAVSVPSWWQLSFSHLRQSCEQQPFHQLCIIPCVLQPADAFQHT